MATLLNLLCVCLCSGELLLMLFLCCTRVFSNFCQRGKTCFYGTRFKAKNSGVELPSEEEITCLTSCCPYRLRTVEYLKRQRNAYHERDCGQESVAKNVSEWCKMGRSIDRHIHLRTTKDAECVCVIDVVILCSYVCVRMVIVGSIKYFEEHGIYRMYQWWRVCVFEIHLHTYVHICKHTHEDAIVRIKSKHTFIFYLCFHLSPS